MEIWKEYETARSDLHVRRNVFADADDNDGDNYGNNNDNDQNKEVDAENSTKAEEEEEEEGQGLPDQLCNFWTITFPCRP
jgi:hypothetical protein